MDNETDADTRPNQPASELLAQSFDHVVAVTIPALPAPVPDTKEARAARDVTTIAQIAALVPVSAAETMMASQAVVANAQGLGCARQALQDLDPDRADRCIHTAAKMMRVAQGAVNVLLRLQTMRMRREATPEAASSALLSEHCAQQLMLQGLAKYNAARQAAAERAAAEQAAAEAARKAARSPPAPEPGPITEADIAAAEAYAQTNPSNLNRARILRRKGGMPNWGMFTPPAANVVRAIAFGHSPFLDSLLPPG